MTPEESKQINPKNETFLGKNDLVFSTRRWQERNLKRFEAWHYELNPILDKPAINLGCS